MQDSFQKVILITISRDIQVNRLVRYRKLDIEDIQARIKHQMPQKEKIALADIVIKNNTSLVDLKLKIKTVFEDIMLLPSLELKSIKL